MKRIGLLLAAASLTHSASACPVTEAARRPAGTLLTLVHGDRVEHLGAPELAPVKPAELLQSQRVSSAATGHGEGANPAQAGEATGATASARSTRFSGWALRDVLMRAGYADPSDRSARLSGVEAIATDGWRAWFSWGEIFNSAAGEQMIIIRQVDDQPLDNHAGPLALRALADLRPGPRHVRQLCALVVVRR